MEPYDGPWEPDKARPAFSCWLFVNTLEDVRRRAYDSEGADEYTLLGIAPLLRKLIKDGHSLAEVVGALHPEVRILYRVRPYVVGSRPGDTHFYLSAQSTLDAGSVDGVKLDRFIKTHIGEFDGKPVTVGDLITHFANVAGGVHLGRISKAMSAAMTGYDQAVPGRNLGWVVHMGYIGRVVYQALLPLQQAVLAAGEAELAPSFGAAKPRA